MVKYFITLGFVSALTSGMSVPAQVATGGGYTLTQTVVASGGGTKNDTVNNVYKIDATSGQPAAGGNLTGGPPNYAVKDGFWAAVPAAPTAAGISISGRVVAADGRGIRGARISVAGGRLSSDRQVVTSGLGYFTIDDLEAGHVYVVTVQAKRFAFAQRSQAVLAADSVTGLVFMSGSPN